MEINFKNLISLVIRYMSLDFTINGFTFNMLQVFIFACVAVIVFRIVISLFK